MTFPVLAMIIALGAMCVALGAVAYRLLRGPSAADRVIATDMLGLIAICVAALVAGLTGYRAFLDVAFGIALFGFLAAVAFGALLEHQGGQEARK